MKKYKLTIPGLLPGLNEYIDAERSYKGKYKAASMKRQAQNVIGYMIRTQLRGVRFTRPVVIRYLWVEPSRRRDKDNIALRKSSFRTPWSKPASFEMTAGRKLKDSATTSPWTRRTRASKSRSKNMREENKMAVSAKIKNLAPGAYFNAGPVEVVVLEHFTDGRTLLAAKEPIGNRPFTVRPFTYNRMEPEPAANNFAFSTLRFDLNEDFLSALDDAGVIPANKVLEAEWSLADHDGTNRYGVAVCKVAMLPEPLVRKYYDAGLLEIDDWEWTITPRAGNAYYVRFVNSDGSLSFDYAYDGDGGVRPAFFVDSEICLSLDQEEIELSDEALLTGFTSKQLVNEVLRRIAAGEDNEDE